ncbi:hypothetical protein ACOSQ2_002679 [Xanthoceras sorbifolium]
MIKSHRPLQDVLREFTSRFTGTLRYWYHIGPTIPSISKQLMVNSSPRSSLQRK